MWVGQGLGVGEGAEYPVTTVPAPPLCVGRGLQSSRWLSVTAQSRWIIQSTAATEFQQQVLTQQLRCDGDQWQAHSTTLWEKSPLPSVMSSLK